MKLTNRILFIVVGIFLLPTFTVTYARVQDAYSPSIFGFPDQLHGYRTLAVFSLQPISCTKPAARVLVLQSPILNLHDYLKRSEITLIDEQVRQIKSSEPDKWSIRIVGPGISRDDVIASYTNLTRLLENVGCAKAVLPVRSPNYTGSDWDEIPAAGGASGFPGLPGYSYFENTDVTSTSSITGVQVYMEAPTIGNDQDLFDHEGLDVGGSRLLLNAQTDGNNPLKIQAGLYFKQHTNPSSTTGQGFPVWTTSALNYIMEVFMFVGYIPGHDYSFTISSVACCADAWDICAMDLTIGYISYECVPADESNSGSELAPNETNGNVYNSVFIENQNLPNNTNWYNGFTNPLVVWAAINFDGSHLPTNWSTNHRHNLHLCDTTPTPSWPTANAVSGTLVNSGVGYFELSGVPPLCDV